MKKFVATFMVICVFTVTNAFAGWIHTTGSFACNPETSEPGTCVWVEDGHSNRATEPLLDDSDSVIKFIKTFISDCNPFDLFLN
jgi:hypothetical protein